MECTGPAPGRSEKLQRRCRVGELLDRHTDTHGNFIWGPKLSYFICLFCPLPYCLAFSFFPVALLSLPPRCSLLLLHPSFSILWSSLIPLYPKTNISSQEKISSHPQVTSSHLDPLQAFWWLRLSLSQHRGVSVGCKERRGGYSRLNWGEFFLQIYIEGNKMVQETPEDSTRSKGLASQGLPKEVEPWNRAIQWKTYLIRHFQLWLLLCLHGLCV